jgi:succinate-semialdehyde dehydrogenase/glutarate-semialdehyde dehydrogenase
MQSIKKIFQMHNLCLVNGQYIDSDKKIPVYNPADNSIITHIPHLNQMQLREAVDTTIKSFQLWSKTSAKERYTFLMKWHDLILSNIDELAKIITLENGKPIADAKSEILYGANFVSWFAAEALRIQGLVTHGVRKDQEIIIKYEPVGPVAAITPWNFPNAMITRKLAPAFAAGCSVILKPSEFTPLSAFALADLAMQAGLPNGVLNIVTGDAQEIGSMLCDEPKLRKLTFTGSTKIGKLLYQQAAKNLKKISLELGGNAPYIIFEDADLDFVIPSLISGKCRSGGQACTSMNRIFIHEKIYGEFIKRIVPSFGSLKVSNGFDIETKIGPLINQAAVERIRNLVEDSISHGAEILSGGDVTIPGSLFFAPTIIANKNTNSRIFSEEIFGPVLSIYKFSSDEEALALANDTDYGLASYIFTNDHRRINFMVNGLDFGIVGINESIVSNEIGAFGGRKDSGIGIEGSSEGIYEFLNHKSIVHSIVN